MKIELPAHRSSIEHPNIALVDTINKAKAEIKEAMYESTTLSRWVIRANEGKQRCTRSGAPSGKFSAGDFPSPRAASQPLLLMEQLLIYLISQHMGRLDKQ